MPIDALLAEVALLPHAARTRRMVELGRAAKAGDAAAAALLGELGSSADAYARSLALASVFGSRDVGYVVARLADPSRTLRYRAGKLLASFGSDAQIVAALAGVPVQQSTRLLFLLKRRGRLSAVDGYVSTLDASSEPQRFDLAPRPMVPSISACSPSSCSSAWPSIPCPSRRGSISRRTCSAMPRSPSSCASFPSRISSTTTRCRARSRRFGIASIPSSWRQRS